MAKYLLLNGKWSALSPAELAQASTEGRFVRAAAQFRHWIKRDGSTPFQPEAGRYHVREKSILLFFLIVRLTRGLTRDSLTGRWSQIYISLACPWASRVYLFLKLKGLEHAIGLSIVSPYMATESWTFDESEYSGVIGDSVNGFSRLYELYIKADANYTGRVTVPVLWDKKTSTIVNNESSEIIRMLNSEFADIVPAAAAEHSHDYYPEALRPAIDAINERVYHAINNGVYRAGFATRQAAYEEAYAELFAALDELEELLGRQRYLVSNDTITEADWRLFTTLVRFDPVYYGHFKCNKRRLAEYPNLFAYTRELYQLPHVADTVNFEHIKHHYYRSHTSINPTQVVPLGPEIDWWAPHGREALAKSAAGSE